MDQKSRAASLRWRLATGRVGMIAALMLPCGVRGQSVGDRVRVPQGPWIPTAYRETDDAYLEGRFQALAGDTLVMGVRGELLRVPLRDTEGFEVGRVVGHEARRWAMVGGAVGVAVGTGIAAGRDDDPYENDEFWSFDDAQIGMLVLSVGLGAGLGALLGYGQKKITWSPAGRPAALLEVRTLPHQGLALGFRIPVPRRR